MCGKEDTEKLPLKQKRVMKKFMFWKLVVIIVVEYLSVR